MLDATMSNDSGVNPTQSTPTSNDKPCLSAFHDYDQTNARNRDWTYPKPARNNDTEPSPELSRWLQNLSASDGRGCREEF